MSIWPVQLWVGTYANGGGKGLYPLTLHEGGEMQAGAPILPRRTRRSGR